MNEPTKLGSLEGFLAAKWFFGVAAKVDYWDDDCVDENYKLWCALYPEDWVAELHRIVAVARGKHLTRVK